MTTRSQVGRVAEYAVGAPGHEVCHARRNVLSAAGAEIRLRGLRLGDGLDVPLATAADLGASPSRGETLDIELGMLLAGTSRPTPGSVRTRHGIQSRLRARRDPLSEATRDGSVPADVLRMRPRAAGRAVTTRDVAEPPLDLGRRAQWTKKVGW